MQTPNGSKVQGYDSFASLMHNTPHAAALRRAAATQDVAVVSRSHREPVSAPTVESNGPRGLKI